MGHSPTSDAAKHSWDGLQKALLGRYGLSQQKSPGLGCRIWRAVNSEPKAPEPSRTVHKVHI